MNNLASDQQFEQFMNVSDGLEMIQFAADTEPAALDALEQRAEEILAQTEDGYHPRAVQERLDNLRQIRAEGPEFVQQHLGQAAETGLRILEEYTDVLVQWITTEEWDASQAFLEEHAEQLLTEDPTGQPG